MSALIEHIATGGFIAWVITAIGVACCAFAVWRITVLYRIASAVKRQRRAASPENRAAGARADNPLARVMRVVAQTKAEANATVNVPTRNAGDESENEVIERRLEEACLRELPPLQFGLSALKLGAAILPMLGLLGTVLGMMEAIQSMAFIGDDRATAMASGISRALITTVLGLAFAIPIVLLHASAKACLTRIATQLDEYCARVLAGSASHDANDHAEGAAKTHSA